MTNLADTSVPTWVLGATTGIDDAAGSRYLLIGVGDKARTVLDRWNSELAAQRVSVIRSADVRSAAQTLLTELQHAWVGTRARFAGTAGTCLYLRAAALTAGLEDDECGFEVTEPGVVDVYCTHCRAVTATAAQIGACMICIGCGRNLVIYHHVSRRTGQFMGYMLDAENGIG